MNNTKAIAMVLLLLGGAALIGGSLASEAIQSERGTMFSISEDENVITAEESGEVVRNPGQGNPATIATLTNNFDEQMTVEFSLALAGESITLEPPDQDSGALTLAPQESESITARCLPPGEGGDMGSGTTTLTLTIHIAQGNTLGVEGLTTTVDVEYDCVGEGPPSQDDQTPSGDQDENGAPGERND